MGLCNSGEFGAIGVQTVTETDAIDGIVGGNIRRLRIGARISQEELGRRLGVTFQQVQKYERGTNRVSAGRLFNIAEALNAPLESLFAGLALPGEHDGETSAPPDPELALAFLSTPGGAALARALIALGDHPVGRQAATLLQTVAATMGGAPPRR